MNMMDTGKQTLVLMMFAIILAMPVYSIGIGSLNDPVKVLPNTETELKFYIINKERQDTTIDISVAGEMAEYVHLKNRTMHLDGSKEVEEIFADVRFPEKIEKTGRAIVIVTEKQNISAWEVSAQKHVASEIRFVSSQQKTVEEPTGIMEDWEETVKEQQEPIEFAFSELLEQNKEQTIIEHNLAELVKGGYSRPLFIIGIIMTIVLLAAMLVLQMIKASNTP